MVLNNLRERFCAICGRRGDNVTKSQLSEIKNDQTVQNLNTIFGKEIKIDDIVCKKHFLKTNNNTSTETQDNIIDENNNELQYLSGYSNDNSSEITQTFQFNDEENQNFDENIDVGESKDDYMIVDLPRTYASHSFCFLCKAPSGMTSSYLLFLFEQLLRLIIISIF